MRIIEVAVGRGDRLHRAGAPIFVAWEPRTGRTRYFLAVSDL